MRVVPILALMLLSACSRSSEVADELPNSSLAGAPREAMPETRIEATLARPVTIGEDGPRLDACGAMGQVTRVGPQGLSVRAAPYAEAKALALGFAENAKPNAKSTEKTTTTASCTGERSRGLSCSPKKSMSILPRQAPKTASSRYASKNLTAREHRSSK